MDQLGDDYTRDEFINTFVDLYYKDWQKIVNRYKEHEEKSKGKWHPMASPRQYIWNVSHKLRNSKCEQFVE